LATVQRNSISSVVTDKIPDQINNLLDNLDFIDKRIYPDSYPNIKWDAVKTMGEDVSKPDPDIVEHINTNNKNLLYTAIGMIVVLILQYIIGMITYYKLKDHNLNIKGLILENLVIFSFVGVIEYLFFKYVASKYIPTTPYNVSKTILNSIADKLSGS
jgi:heme A synthase